MVKNWLKTIAVILFAAFIPFLLVLDTYQTKLCLELHNEIRVLDRKQYELIESNNRLLTNISILSSPERIETIARDVLHMRKANPDEIIRIEIKGKKVGG